MLKNLRLTRVTNSRFRIEAAQAGADGLVLLFDEFDVLGNHAPTNTPDQAAGDQFFPYLRQWMTNVADVNFIFVIGRRPEDLSLNSMSTFKGTRTIQVSTMSQADTEWVIRQSEQNGSLTWPPEVVQMVWDWTNGHPYMTQLLCYVIWEIVVDAHEEAERDGIPTATPQAVAEAIPQALQQGANAFQWIWDGLPPAEKIVMAAMAGSAEERLTLEGVEQILLESGVQLIVSEMTIAPDKLTKWGLLIRDNDHFRFRVPLLREWTRRQRPLHQVKDELDRLDPLADQLYLAGRSYHNLHQLEQACNQLQQAIDINPNHLKANLLLAQIYFQQEKLPEAREILERMMQYDSSSAKADLVRIMLAQARQSKDEADKLALYQQILQISPQQPIARRAVQEALLVKLITDAEKLEQTENWSEALAIYQAGAKEFPKENKWKEAIKRVEVESMLAQLYREAVGAIELDNKDEARETLLKIMGIRPAYKNVVEKLLWVVKEIDVTELQDELVQVSKKSEAEANKYRQQQATWDKDRDTLERIITELEANNRQLTTKLTQARTNNSSVRSSPSTRPNGHPAVLSLSNPLAYLRLLWWIFIKPENIKKYRDTHGEKSLEFVGNGLASLLTWLPVLLLLLALGFGIVPTSTEAWPSTIYVWLAGGGGMICLAVGWLLPRWQNEDVKSGLAFGLAVGLAIGLADVVAFVVAVGVVGVVVGVVAVVVVAGLEFSVASAVAAGVAAGVAFGLAAGVAFGLAGVVAAGVAGIVAAGVAGVVAGVIAFVVVYVIAAGVAAGVVAGVAAGVAGVVEKAVEDGRRNFWTVSSGLALVVSYLFLILFLVFNETSFVTAMSDISSPWSMLQSKTPPTDATLGDNWVRPIDSMTMVYVPNGTFLMGSEEGDNNANPIRVITVDSFWIDKTEVTNAQYNLCVADGVCDASGRANDIDFNVSQQPVVSMSWYNAVTYCEWVGGRLPTEAEWEYAARGPDNNIYPWGNEVATCDVAHHAFCEPNHTTVVGTTSPNGDSWVGVADMAGNAREWVTDWYDAGDGIHLRVMDNPTGPMEGTQKVLKGGSWAHSEAYLQSSNRTAHSPVFRFSNMGMRCVYPLP